MHHITVMRMPMI